jgi:diguanylate cyclase (GGDEF)-like protein
MLNRYKEIIKTLDFAFQPIVNIRNGKIFAVEALLRNYKEAGFNSIFSVFDEAYHNGNLYRLDLHLRKKAFEKFKTINIPNLKIFYNLDNRLIYSPDFTYGNTLKILQYLNLNQKQVCFELSERNTLKDPSSITNMVNRYRQEGFDIAIDDFGTGIAGFQLLYYAETNFIKIDRFFIENINGDPKKRLFCSSIINMAHLMGIKVIAEGIETKDEYFTCKEIGADFIQGYFVQKPQMETEKLKEQYQKIKELFNEEKRKGRLNKIDKDKITKIRALDINSSLYDVFVYFRENPKNFLVPIINEIGELCGVVYEEDLKPFSYSPFGASLAQNKNSKQKLKSLIKDAVSADINWSIDKLLEIYNLYARNTKGIFITKNNKYYGFIDLQNLLLLSYKRNLEIASDQNPLTKLPGNKKIEEFLCYCFKNKDKRDFHIIYFDFNNFKPFNDYYGFRRGDRAIMMFADILRKKLCDGFIAHIGGDDFFVGFENKNFETVKNCIEKITDTFEKQIGELYDKEDRKNGHIEIEDRYGIKRKFPLLSVSFLVLEITSHTDENSFDLSIGKLKQLSKKLSKVYACLI